MTPKVVRRCGCRDENGKQYGQKCPRLSDPSHGSWGYRIRAGNIAGKDQWVTGAGFDTAMQASLACERAETIAKKARETAKHRRLGNSPTVESVGLKWSAVNTQWGVQTRRFHEPHLRDILREIGYMPIDTVDAPTLADFLNEHTHTDATYNGFLATLRGIFNYAWELGLIRIIPTRSIPPKVLPPSDAWDKHEVIRFLDASKCHRYGSLFQVALYTGLRQGELCALRWEDVDLDKGLINVRHSLGPNAEYEKAPKNGRERCVPIEATVVAILRQWRTTQLGSTNRVFAGPNGGDLRPVYVARIWPEFTRTAGLRPIRFHDLRGTYASIQRDRGISLDTVSKILGHANIQTTYEAYDHLLGDRNEQARGITNWLAS